MFIYNIFIAIYTLAAKLAASMGHKKAARLHRYRQLPLPVIDKRPLVWIHAASAGEGNQAIPIALAFREKHNATIVISFYSPSGYDFHAQEKAFDHVVMMQADLPDAAQSFISRLKPDLVVFIRKELWLNHLLELTRRRIPSFLVNAPLHLLDHQNPILKAHDIRCLRTFTRIYPIHEMKDNQWKDLSLSEKLFGDTKWEGAQLGKELSPDPVIQTFCQDHRVIIMGSSWPEEELLVLKWLLTNDIDRLKIIIAPHEVNPDRIKHLQNSFSGAVLYSDPEKSQDARIMILDAYGKLRGAYAFADVAVIGGGFGKGLHNVLEAIVWQVPVVFGPAYQNFPEAVELAMNGMAFPVRDSAAFDHQLNQLMKDAAIREGIAIKIGLLLADKKAVSVRIVADMSAYLISRTSTQ